MKIPVKQLTQALKLETIYAGESREIEFTTPELNRPGLALAGFFDYFASDRMQILGKHELTYLMTALDEDCRYHAMDALMATPLPCVVVCRGMDLPVGLKQLAVKYRRPLFRTQVQTNQFIHQATTYLNRELAPRESLHGVLVDVYGVGVLIIGDSGIGKSETALELLRRGHRLVADDLVEVRKVDDTLSGTSPENIRHFMEIRGIGIINIRQLYGIGAVLLRKDIEMICRLEPWDPAKQYERLGLEESSTEVLGVTLPLLTVPVVPGRNIAIVIEVAARNRRLRLLGYSAAEELTTSISSTINGSDDN